MSKFFISAILIIGAACIASYKKYKSQDPFDGIPPVEEYIALMDRSGRIG